MRGWGDLAPARRRALASQAAARLVARTGAAAAAQAWPRAAPAGRARTRVLLAVGGERAHHQEAGHLAGRRRQAGGGGVQGRWRRPRAGAAPRAGSLHARPACTRARAKPSTVHRGGRPSARSPLHPPRTPRPGRRRRRRWRRPRAGPAPAARPAATPGGPLRGSCGPVDGECATGVWVCWDASVLQQAMPRLKPWLCAERCTGSRAPTAARRPG